MAPGVMLLTENLHGQRRNQGLYIYIYMYIHMYIYQGLDGRLKKFRTVLAKSVVRALTVWLVSSAPSARFLAKYPGARIRLLACLERA